MARKPFQQVIDDLTLDQAKEWNEQQDKFLWVEYNILDIAGYVATDRRVEMIEVKFEEILKTNNITVNW